MAYKIFGVYMIRNIVNGKLYFGSSQNCHSRLAGQVAALRRGDNTNTLLLHEWGRFGEDAFEFVVIAEVSNIDEAIRQENELIERYNTTDEQFGYNSMLRGRWSTAARIRNTEKKLIAKRKYELLPNVSLTDPMAPDFVQSAKKGHHDTGSDSRR